MKKDNGPWKVWKDGANHLGESRVKQDPLPMDKWELIKSWDKGEPLKRFDRALMLVSKGRTDAGMVCRIYKDQEPGDNWIFYVHEGEPCTESFREIAKRDNLLKLPAIWEPEWPDEDPT